jgi:hypothetical protein
MRLVGVGSIHDTGHLFVATELLQGGSLQKVVMNVVGESKTIIRNDNT